MKNCEQLQKSLFSGLVFAQKIGRLSDPNFRPYCLKPHQTNHRVATLDSPCPLDRPSKMQLFFDGLKDNSVLRLVLTKVLKFGKQTKASKQSCSFRLEQ